MSGELITIASRAARRAGAILRGALAEGASVLFAEGKDIKHEADLRAEQAILEVLAESGLPILSEEAGASQDFCGEDFWVVDPLDGTFNFSRGFPVCCVAVALCRGGEPVLGVINDFQHDLVFEGGEGLAARGNGKAISVSAVSDTGQAALATGFPVGRSYEGEALQRFIAQIQEFKKIRMIGSASSSLALVARGIFDAYFEEDINLWDVAAGMAIVKAAGGVVEVLQRGEGHRVTVFAHNGRMALKQV